MITSSNSPISFFYDQNINSTEVHYQEPPFILLSPSSFDNNESPLCQIFPRNDVPTATDHQETNNKNVSSGKKKGSELEINRGIKPHGRRKNHASEPWKRTGKKDRHSKICTVQGVRDRRMRLSLPIARKFFDLQDMLGFDKASNTIEWLLSKSRKDIKELLINHHLPLIKHSYLVSSDDDTETLKQGDENSEQARDEIIINEKEGGSKSGKAMENYHNNAKEAREKARERARERTREKMKAQISKLWYDVNPSNNNLDQPFSAIEFYDSQNGAFLEVHAHPIEPIYENLGSFDDSIRLIQMDNQMFNMENNVEMSVPHGIDCSYTNIGFNRMPENWDSNGTRMNPSSIGATSNIESFLGNHTPSFGCLPSIKFPFSLQY